MPVHVAKDRMGQKKKKKMLRDQFIVEITGEEGREASWNTLARSTGMPRGPLALQGTSMAHLFFRCAHRWSDSTRGHYTGHIFTASLYSRNKLLTNVNMLDECRKKKLNRKFCTSSISFLLTRIQKKKRTDITFSLKQMMKVN